MELTMHVSLTDKQLDELYSHIVILTQTNEQVNDHILGYFDSVGIRYRQRSFRDGDYGFILEACPSLGIMCDIAFDDDVFIERKNSLQELAQSIYGHKVKRGAKSEYDDAFIRELKRAINKRYKFLLVEQDSGWSDVADKNYPNDYSVKAFEGSLNMLEVRYGLHIRFVRREEMGKHIYGICKTIVKEWANFGFR